MTPEEKRAKNREYTAKYRALHSERRKSRRRELRLINREAILLKERTKHQTDAPYRNRRNAASKRWKQRNPDKVAIQTQNYMAKHPDWAEKLQAWTKNNKERYKEVRRIACRRSYHIRKSDPVYKIAKNMRARIRNALVRRGSFKNGGTVEYIGCSVDELRLHIERQWKPGMSWENYGPDSWHIDHIRPCASFDLTDPEQQKQCFHWTNVQPLWAKENISKNDWFNGQKVSKSKNNPTICRNHSDEPDATTMPKPPCP